MYQFLIFPPLLSHDPVREIYNLCSLVIRHEDHHSKGYFDILQAVVITEHEVINVSEEYEASGQ